MQITLIFIKRKICGNGNQKLGLDCSTFVFLQNTGLNRLQLQAV